MKKFVTILLVVFVVFAAVGCTSQHPGGIIVTPGTPVVPGDITDPSDKDGFLRMGMNISDSNYYHSRNLMFNDVMKTKHRIGTALVLQGGYSGQLDDNGYPKEVVRPAGGMWDPNAPAILINDIYAGDYVFLYDGDGDIEFADGIEVTSSQPNKIYLKLTECVRTPTFNPHRRVVIRRSNINDNVRNMRMIPIEFENSEQIMPLFRKDFLDGLRGMQVLRFMDAQYTNNSTQRNWSERPLVSDWAYDIQGLPIEILISLANTLNADAWFCVPHKASDDYMRQMAKLIKERLNSSLKCYIEYSNEIWHSGFPQGKWIENPSDSVDAYVKTDIAALKSPLYGTDNRHLKNAYFMGRTFKIFEAEFDGAARARLVTVGTYYFWLYPREIMQYLIDEGVKPDVMAGTGYFNFTEDDHEGWLENPESVTADDIIAAVQNGWETYAATKKTFVDMVHEFDIKYVVYEGGQHMQPYNQEIWPYNQAVYDAQIHPKMYDLYMENFELHAELECEIFVNFSYVGLRESQHGSWGALENISDIYSDDLKNVSPKYQAILDANKTGA